MNLNFGEKQSSNYKRNFLVPRRIGNKNLVNNNFYTLKPSTKSVGFSTSYNASFYPKNAKKPIKITRNMI